MSPQQMRCLTGSNKYHCERSFYPSTVVDRLHGAIFLASTASTASPSLQEWTNLWATNGGVYFGYQCEAAPDPDQPLAGDWSPKPEMHRYTSDRHLITIGPNGSGKSRRLLMPNLAVLTGWSILVIDPKGELAAKTAQHRRDKGRADDVVFLNPFGVSGFGSNGFNPITVLDPADEDFVDDAMSLADAMIRVEGNEPHWSASAQDLVCALIMYARLQKDEWQDEDGTKHHCEPAKCNLSFVRECLGQPSEKFCEIVASMMRTGIKRDCPELYTKAARFLDINPENKELNSILSTAMTQTRWLDSRPIKADLAHGFFDFSQMKQRPITIYLILPARRLGTHSTWLRLIIASVLQALLKDTRTAKVPCLLMFDEMAQLGHLPIIENSLAIMRGYGIKLWAVYQDLAQPEAIYGKRWESFVANADVIQSFAPRDMTTREYISKFSGQRLYWLKVGSSSDTKNLGGLHPTQSTGVTEGWQNIQGPLYWPQPLAAMKDGQAVLFARGKAHRTWLPDPSTMPHLQELMQHEVSKNAAEDLRPPSGRSALGRVQ